MREPHCLTLQTALWQNTPSIVNANLRMPISHHRVNEEKIIYIHCHGNFGHELVRVAQCEFVSSVPKFAVDTCNQPHTIPPEHGIS